MCRPLFQVLGIQWQTRQTMSCPHGANILVGEVDYKAVKEEIFHIKIQAKYLFSTVLASGAVRTAVNMIEDGAEWGWQVATSNRVVMGGPAGETWKMGRSQF